MGRKQVVNPEIDANRRREETITRIRIVKDRVAKIKQGLEILEMIRRKRQKN